MTGVPLVLMGHSHHGQLERSRGSRLRKQRQLARRIAPRCTSSATQKRQRADVRVELRQWRNGGDCVCLDRNDRRAPAGNELPSRPRRGSSPVAELTRRRLETAGEGDRESALLCETVGRVVQERRRMRTASRWPTKPSSSSKTTHPFGAHPPGRKSLARQGVQGARRAEDGLAGLTRSWKSSAPGPDHRRHHDAATRRHDVRAKRSRATTTPSSCRSSSSPRRTTPRP